MNIKDLSIEQLKALAYDHLVNVNNSNLAIQAIEKELQERRKVEPKKDV